MISEQWRSLRLATTILLCAVVFFEARTSSVVYAGIVSSSGVTLLGGPPAPNVLPGSQPPATTPIFFPEFINGFVPVGGVPVDHDGSIVASLPVTTAGVVNPLLVKSVIPAGAKVDSYFFHFDPVDTITPGVWNFYPAVSIEFDRKIIGVQLFSSADPLQKPALTPYTGTLESGDSVPVFNGGPTPPYYPGGLITRGLDEDTLSINLGGNQINLNGQAFGSEIDQVRIFVDAVPEPTSLVLVSMGLLGLIFSGITRVERARRS